MKDVDFNVISTPYGVCPPVILYLPECLSLTQGTHMAAIEPINSAAPPMIPPSIILLSISEVVAIRYTSLLMINYNT